MKKLIITLSAVFFITTTISANNGTQALQAKDFQQKITNLNNDLYYWEVESDYGKASGYSISLEKAEKMLELVGIKDITKYTKIISK